MSVPYWAHVDTIAIPVHQDRFRDSEEIQEHQRTAVLDKAPLQLSKMDPISGSYPLPNVHRSALIYPASVCCRFAFGVLRWFAGPDEFRLRRQIDVDHVSQSSHVHGVFSQSVAEAVVRVAEQHEQIGRR